MGCTFHQVGSGLLTASLLSKAAEGKRMSKRDDRAAFLERIEVISVPTRVDLIDALKIKGSATSTELARVVPEGRSATRWHLERLEHAGFIRRRPDTKPPVWEPAQTRMDWSDPGDKQVTLALQELERVLTDRRRRRLSEWALGRWERPWVGTEWSNAAISHDYVLPAARAEDLDWLDAQMTQVMAQFRERVQDLDPAADDVEGAFVTLGAFPWRPGRKR